MDDPRKYMILKPLRKRLEEASQRNMLRLDIIQQDYLLSWLLAGIYQQKNLKTSLIFKGGTALKKGYFGSYRFSEDLDFSTTSFAPSKDELLRDIKEACKYAEEKINEYGSIQIFVKRYVEKNPHPLGQEAFKISAQFPWQSQPLTSAMVEISKEETILYKPVSKPIIHDYGESIDQHMLVYSLEEIVLEKLRAILQHTKKLHERDWSRSRARDYYDLWRIFNSFEKNLFFDEFTKKLYEKCFLKNVNFNSFEAFFDPLMMDNISKSWEKWLGPLVKELPESNKVIEELKIKIKFLLEK